MEDKIICAPGIQGYSFLTIYKFSNKGCVPLLNAPITELPRYLIETCEKEHIYTIELAGSANYLNHLVDEIQTQLISRYGQNDMSKYTISIV